MKRFTTFFLLICLFTLALASCHSTLEAPMDRGETKAQATVPDTEPKEAETETAEETCAIPLGTNGKIPLKVVSFNVNTYNPNAEGAIHWDNRKDALCDYILSFDADVICTQETPEIYRDYFAEKLGGVYGWEHFNHNMIFYRLDRFEKLSFTPYYYGTDPTAKAPAYDASMERNFSLIHLREKTCNAEFYAVATHLDHKGLKARIFAAKQLVETLSQSTVPYVLCGDFNSNEESYAYRDLTEAFLDTAKIAKVADKGRTFNKWGEAEGDGLPIDFIFVSPVNITAKSFRILRDLWGEKYLYSDHYPICAELELAY